MLRITIFLSSCPAARSERNFQSCFFNIYRFSNVTKSFEEAQSSCASNGGKLFEPRNLKQNKEVADAAYKIHHYPPNYWWIGADDKEREGSFQWSTSEKNINFSNWMSGQPNDFNGNQDCVGIYISSNSVYHGKWYDYTCSIKHFFICEFP